MEIHSFIIFLLTLILLSMNTIAQLVRARELHVAHQESNQNYRLPITFTPLHYVISLVPHIFPGNFTFDGQVHITGFAARATHKIVLHSEDMEPISINVASLNSQKKIQINFTEYNSTTHMYIIHLNKMLMPGALHNISIKYTGHLRDDLAGFYRSWYITAENKTRWIAATQLEATHARRVFPCFDEPALKATFQINVARTPDMHTLSNMPLDTTRQGSLPEIPGRVWDHFAETPRMSTYMIGILVSDFKGRSTSDGKFVSWSQEGMMEQTELSVRVSPSLLQAMENYTTINYTIPKMDQAPIPDFRAGAMENWGLITYSEHVFLHKEGVSSTLDMQKTVNVIAHELTHMWLGNLVTPNWWKDVWLSESFATYFSYYLSDQVYPDWHTEEQFLTEKVQPAMAFDSSNPTRAVSSDAQTPSEIRSKFDIISYDKAGAIIRQTVHFLTHNTFRKGIRKYLTTRQYMEAEPDHLFYALNEAQKEDKILPDDFDVKTIMKTWIYQAGIPVIHMERSGDYIRIKQERFSYDADLQDNSTWWIPISYTTSEEFDFKDTRPKAWLKGERQMKLVNGISKEHWVILNVQATGYYRVNYDDLTWTLFIQHMRNSSFESIHPLNRGQLINDAFNLARVELLNYSKAFDLSEYLRQENHLLPWTSFYNVINYLYHQLYRTEALQPFKNYVLELLEPLIWKAMNETASEHMEKLLLQRAMQWATKFEHPECIEMAAREFDNWSTDPINNRFNADFQQTLLCTAVHHGGEKEFDQVWNYYLQTNIPTEKKAVLLALGCSSDSTRYLKKLIEMEGIAVRKKDIQSGFRAAWSDPSKVPDAINFTRQQLDQLNAPQPNRKDELEDRITNMFVIISEHITKSEELAELEEMLKSVKEKLKPELFTKAGNSLNEARKNLEWNKQNVKDIHQWLNSRRSLPRDNLISECDNSV